MSEKPVSLKELILTASSSADIKLKGIECRAEDYITEPFEKELLIARVENIIKTRNTLKKFFFDTITLCENNQNISSEYKGCEKLQRTV